MILACRPTDKLTELITSAMEKNEERKWRHCNYEAI